MHFLTYFGLFIPLIGFILLVASSTAISRFWAGLIGCTTIFLSFASFITLTWLFTHYEVQDQNLILFNWIPIEGIEAEFKLHVDPLALLMTLIITGIGFLIHIYSNGYMDTDPNYARYFACMNFFVFAMLLLVLAGHLLLLFAGWEGVGLASYLLIGFWYNHPPAAQAATKAFVMNRIGDFGLLIGLLLTFYIFRTGDMEIISHQAKNVFQVGAPLLTILTLLYFVGAIGKSAQIPLHTWLPDAMEGPTPVSALIHAATMVTAGVYLIVRMHPVFSLAPATLHVIGIIGAVTSLFASLWALGQTDLKKVLANSTISQLGLMFVACGAGAYYAAMFHLTMHAFMKSLLFLSAGNIVHALNGVTEMEKMGGLRNKMKITHIVFIVGVLAMSGIPPFAAFFSKDMILEQEYMSGFFILFYVSLAASVLTGVYLIRAYCLTFLSKPRMETTQYQKIHEARKVMVYPLIILAFLSFVGGGLGFSLERIPFLAVFLKEIDLNPFEKVLSTHFILSYETIIAILGAFLGVIVTFIVYTRYTEKLGPTFQFLKKSFYMDEIYDYLFTRPLKILSREINLRIEPLLFDGFIEKIKGGVYNISYNMQKIQSGQIRSYIAWMVLGMSFFICLVIYRTKY